MKDDLQLEEQLAEMFPNNPYPTQLKLALDIYQNLSMTLSSQAKVNSDNSNKLPPKVMMIQSPTGTGKTYALLIGVIKWLQDHPNALQQQPKQQQQNNNGNYDDSNSSLPPWLNKLKDNKKQQLLLQQKQVKIKKMKTLAEYKAESKNQYIAKDKNKNNSNKQQNVQWLNQQAFDEEFDVDNMNNIGKKKTNNSDYEKKFKKIILKYDEDQEKQCLPKIIFASRTHTQLSQVIESINKLAISSNQHPIRAVSLASKDHLCIHPNIQNQPQAHQKCQYLLSNSSCPYYLSQPLQDFLNLPIQQSHKLGKLSQLCPYYITKCLSQICNIICIPYISIINQQIRKKLNININNSIIIFDEAHNIIEQQLNMKSPELKFTDLRKLDNRLQMYMQKYGGYNKIHKEDIPEKHPKINKNNNKYNKNNNEQQRIYQRTNINTNNNNIQQIPQKQTIKTNNLTIVKHLHQIVRQFLRVIQKQNQQLNKDNNTNHQTEQLPKYTKMSKVQFFIELNLEQIQLSKIKYYISLTNFDQKLAFFNKQQVFPMGILSSFIDFLTQLTNIYNNQNKIDQKIGATSIVLIKKSEINTNKNNLYNNINNKSDASIKILSLQSSQLNKIFQKSRMSILAGGTMQPIHSFISMFKKYNLQYRYNKYPHIIKANQCSVYIISKIKSNNLNKNTQEIKFTYKQTKNKQKLQEVIQNAKAIIEDIILNKTEKKSGTVVFIQSYQILSTIKQIFGEYFYENNYKIFYDSQDKNQKSFQAYSKQIMQKKNSAVLVSVMGGKLSEGINFADQLARSIVVLGLPYPNLKSPEMIQKMKYLNIRAQYQKQRESGFKTVKRYQQIGGLQNGQQYYENVCYKTLNQTIGRGIRHINDYANIYLVDSRFRSIAGKLSGWLVERIKDIQQ